MDWEAPKKPAEYAESRLIDAILDGRFPIDSCLPSERELAALLGVTRPTLREALQRMTRDGWIEIRHGKPTRVRNYWTEGNLGVLSLIAHHYEHIPLDFVSNLLTVRRLLAPAYTRLAIERSPDLIEKMLEQYINLEDRPEVFAQADFELHRQLTIASGNPIFTLILNGFTQLYQEMACVYFASPDARAHSREFYRDLLESIKAGDPFFSEIITQRVMSDSLNLWLRAIQ